jgi:hypothetical protein
MKRPGYVRCVKRDTGDPVVTSWCGQQLSNFDMPFQSIDHAAFTIESEGRLIPCEDCAKAIIAIFSRETI